MAPLPPKILSFSTVFPRPGDESLGLFVRSRLLAAASFADIHVLAPVALAEYGNAARRFPSLGAIPLHHQDGPLTVHHPRWFYPPAPTFANPIFLHLATRPFARQLRNRFPFQLIDAHFGFPDGAAAARLARSTGVPYTVTLRGNETMHAGDPLRRRSLQSALRGAAHVITVSRALLDFALSLGVEAGRATLIPNGIDSSVFFPRPRAACRARLEMSDDSVHLLSAGYLIERKGHHLLIDALARLRAHGLNAILWIVGGPGREGNFTPAIHEAVQRTSMTPYVRFAGPVAPTQLAEFMCAADLFCLASSREGWPNVVNEALACVTPVAASRVGAIPDMLPSGEYGLIADTLEPQSLAATIRQALSRQWDREAIARWGQSRSWNHTAREVADVWHHSLQEAPELP